MRTAAFRVLLAATSILLAGALNGCMNVTHERDISAGINGGFEIVRSGVPVNWIIQRNTFNEEDAEISIDTTDKVEGKQSLRFAVHSFGPFSESREWSLAQVLPAESLRTYRVSFWLKNRGCTEVTRVYRTLQYQAWGPGMETLGEAEMGTDTWRQFEFTHTIPAKGSDIRFTLGISQACTLWIDDVRIEEVHTDSGRSKGPS